jgi:hypothetical protein
MNWIYKVAHQLNFIKHPLKLYYFNLKESIQRDIRSDNKVDLSYTLDTFS